MVTGESPQRGQKVCEAGTSPCLNTDNSGNCTQSMMAWFNLLSCIIMCMKVGVCLLRDFTMGRGKGLFLSCLFLTIHLTDYP